MTNKFLLNLLGFNPDLTSRQPRVDSLSLVSRQSDVPMYADSRSWKCVGIKVKEDQKSGVHCWFSLYSQNTISRIHVRTL